MGLLLRLGERSRLALSCSLELGDLLVQLFLGRRQLRNLPLQLRDQPHQLVALRGREVFGLTHSQSIKTCSVPHNPLPTPIPLINYDGRIVNVSVVVATAVNGEGKREIIGMDVGTSEDGAFWLAFLCSLSARGLGGVELVVSDAHQGLRGAIAAVFGGASWQRCRTHFMTNLLTRVPRRAQPWVVTMRTIYQQPSPDEVHAQLDRVRSTPEPVPSSLLDEAPDVLAFSLPLAHWKKTWSNNPQDNDPATRCGDPTFRDLRLLQAGGGGGSTD